jgi:hypothetical protein
MVDTGKRELRTGQLARDKLKWDPHLGVLMAYAGGLHSYDNEYTPRTDRDNDDGPPDFLPMLRCIERGEAFSVAFGFIVSQHMCSSNLQYDDRAVFAQVNYHRDYGFDYVNIKNPSFDGEELMEEALVNYVVWM